MVSQRAAAGQRTPARTAPQTAKAHAAGLAGAASRASKAALSKFNANADSLATTVRASARKLRPQRFRADGQFAQPPASPMRPSNPVQPSTTHPIPAGPAGTGAPVSDSSVAGPVRPNNANHPGRRSAPQKPASPLDPVATRAAAPAGPTSDIGGLNGVTAGRKRSFRTETTAATAAPTAIGRRRRLATDPTANPAQMARVQRRMARTARILHRLKRASAGCQQSQPAATGWRAAMVRQLSKCRTNWRWCVGLGLTLILIIGLLYWAVMQLMPNRQTAAQDIQKTIAAAQNGDSAARQAAEGKDEQEVSAEVINNYTVAAELPRILQIDKLGGIRARVLSMGVNDDGSMQAPINIADAGWYSGSVRPGQAGAVVVVGHVTGPTKPGLFARLGELAAGDELTLERGDGQTVRYQVVTTETIKLSDVDMHKFMRPVEGAQEGLNLMTCAADRASQDQAADQRVMVYTKRI